MHAFRLARFAATTFALFLLVGVGSAHALLTTQELKCSTGLAKAYTKYEAAVLKEITTCRDNDISGEVDSSDKCATLPMPSLAKIATAKGKFISSVAKACQSTCNVSTDKICVNDIGCPPNNATAERCTGKGSTKPFRIAHLGFDGPYCPALLGHPIETPEQIGDCLSEMSDVLTDDLIANLYGNVDETSGLSADAAKCLAAISKATSKSIGKIHGAVAKCRQAQQGKPRCTGGTNAGKPCSSVADCGGGGSCGSDPEQCLFSDAGTVASVAKEVTKLKTAIEKGCPASTVTELPALCVGSGATPTTLAEAQDCVVDLVEEVAASVEGPSRRAYTPYSMLIATNPDAGFAYCGDGVVNQTRTEGNPLGEECDGDDTPCGTGHCAPPGDLFECTCDNIPRERSVMDGDRVDSDAGWTGDSHDATHNDGFGFVTDLSNCTCSEFNDATCVGISGDSICDETANRAPRCSNAMDSSLTCDQRGDNDNITEDEDCSVCDANSINAGAYCRPGGGSPSETVCLSQCFNDVSGLPTGTCDKQTDCAAGETCKGRCDTTPTCKTITEGSPLPQVSAAISVCIQLQYVTDIEGTKDIVNGDALFHYTTRSVIYLNAGGTSGQPCPVCGGSCVGGTSAGYSCFGRCNGGTTKCLVDSDCGMGESCEETDDDCGGGYCSLDLRCDGGDRDGLVCRPMSDTPLGVVSADCPPAASKNLSGFGVIQNFGDVTTEARQFPVGSACSDPAWHNYTCPCPQGSSAIATAPNRCAAACSTTGVPCSTYTTCSGGTDAGSTCDEDADCEGGLCNNTPPECTGGGRCVPLCYPQGTCNGGPRDGDDCAVADQCDGSPCVVTDTEDGLCAAGPLKYRCTGAGYRSVPCDEADVNTQKGCEAGEDGTLGNADDVEGAGFCESRPLDCFYNNGAQEGGGTPSDFKYVSNFCTAPAGNPAIDTVSGFGGPSKIRRYGSATVNVPSIPVP